MHVYVELKLKKKKEVPTFHPKPEMETVLLLKDFLKTILAFEVGEPLLSREHKRSLNLVLNLEFYT